MLKVDIGSGGCKPEGFVGVDRFPIENVDIVADINEALPFESDSVDLLYASHSLEHVRDLMHTMREIYRICKHGAQVCIIAPYNEQKLNLANPYHTSVFNEHTPRFWTNYPHAPIDVSEFAHPHATGWGLSTSDNSCPGLDIRLARMEFFYFPEYRNLSVGMQRKYRQTFFDVCDQIMYHLIIYKEEKASIATTYQQLLASFEPFEPDYIKRRKAQELEARHHTGTEHSSMLEPTQKDTYIDSLLLALNFAQREAATHSSSINGLILQNRELIEQLNLAVTTKAKSITFQAELDAANGLLGWHKGREEALKARVNDLELKLLQTEDQLKDIGELHNAKEIISSYADEVSALRASRRLSWATAISKRKDNLSHIAPPFEAMKSYTISKVSKSRRSQLELSRDLRNTSYFEYSIPVYIESLHRISLAIRPLLSTRIGTLGIEILDSENKILCQTTTSISSIDANLPTKFSLDQPIGPLSRGWKLRVFTNTDTPITLYEVVTHRLLRSLIRMPLCQIN